jgi:anti-anti-sigma factor
MSLMHHIEDTHATITLGNNFTYNDSTHFRESLNNVLARKIARLTIQLFEVHFMDSSGLGMLMVTKNECEARDITLHLSQPKGEIKKLLELTKCYELFSILE